MEVKGEYDGKGFWALVLGGSSGLGWATVKQLAGQGMNIAMVHRDRKSFIKQWMPEWESVENLPIKTLRWNKNALLEDSQKEIIKELVESLGKEGQIRVFVHAISRGNLKKMSGDKSLSKEDLLQTAQAMGTSYYDWVKALKEYGLFSKGGRCIGFTSAGNQRVWPNYAAVSAAKNTLESLSRSMAVEWGPEGIRSNLIQAGITDTASLRMIPGWEKLLEHAEHSNPLGRGTRAGDVARVVDLLCREESDWINGAIIPVDGGENLL
ncbi:MAG: SDR family oxidoreductase [Bacteroidetes bacterium]|jgi:enoyl-[acyl-carrier protein] reductase I|nr:SDR family oxidoreductase [Bacteroidota bacterium]